MSVFSEIKERVSCVDVCRQYGVDLDRGNFTRCLWHNEKTGSLKIYAGNRGFHCFGCGVSGSVIDLTMKLFDESTGEACKRLSADFRLGLFENGNISRAEQMDRNRRAWERRRREAALEAEHNKLRTEFLAAVEYLRWVELGFWAAAPVDPDEEWSECFVESAAMRDRARARADEALEALFEFEDAKRAS